MNNALPIAEYRDKIITCVRENPVTIITAETGAGKSTQVPQYLLDEGYALVVTQPRRLAARTVSERVADEYGCELGSTVGYRTAFERADSPNTRCLFVTDGLALVRELMGVGSHQVLVLDEVHEWNINIEVLVAWVRSQVAHDHGFKVVLMSATMEAERLSAFFSRAPIISVPGRQFSVTEQTPGASMVDDVVSLAQAGRNVLVFQPGKAEIGEMVSRLKELRVCAEILPLHGELSVEQQKQCFRRYRQPKIIVSTNVAQTSVTIDDIDAVVDSGTERRIELVDGVEGLYLKPISLADSAQRKGRAGRTKPGIYIDHCATMAEHRHDFPKAEILRTRLDQTVLRLAETGFDAEELEFFHQPDRSKIHEAKRALRALGCLDARGAVTPIGHRVSKMPISVQFARMIVEADQLGVVDDILDIAAILEVGELHARKDAQGNESYAWRSLCRDEASSDIFAQLMIYRAAQDMSKDEMREKGVHIKAFYRTKEVRRHLADSLRGRLQSSGTTGKRDDIVRSISAGMVDHLYQRSWDRYVNGRGDMRRLSRDSVLGRVDWVIALPFDIEIKTRFGTDVLQLLRMATKVDPKVLISLAPHLVRRARSEDARFDPDCDAVVTTNDVYFDGMKTGQEDVPEPAHPHAQEIFAEWIVKEML